MKKFAIHAELNGVPVEGFQAGKQHSQIFLLEKYPSDCNGVNSLGLAAGRQGQRLLR